MKRTLFLLMLATLLGCKEKAPVVTYAYYADYQGREVPDFSSMGTPNTTGVLTDFTLDGIPGGENDHYAVQFKSTLKVKKADTYTFYLSSDDGSMLYIDQQLVIDSNGEHGTKTVTGQIDLQPGNHDIRIDYFEYHKGQLISLLYSNSEVQFQSICPVSHTTPRFVMAQAKETYQRFCEWKGNDSVVVFPIITDVHSCARTAYQHIGYLVETDRLFHYDFMANLGDIGLNTPPARDQKAYARRIVNLTQNEMLRYPGVFLYAPGNHDFDAGGGEHITSAMLSEWFQQPFQERSNGHLHINAATCSSWYDVPGKPLRVITLNSEADETLGDYYYTFGNEQLEWLRQVMEETPADKSVLVMSHYQPHKVGRWYLANSRSHQSCNDLMDYLAEFNANPEPHARLVGMFCGDSHANCHVVDRGVNYYITQGYGDTSPSLLPPELKRVYFDYHETLCIDIVAIKPANGQIHTFRMGAGGADMDYDFCYQKPLTYIENNK